jgi:hypothetical protein
LALAGFGVTIGVIVLLRYLAVPFFLYYPRIGDPILVSAEIDDALFVLSSLAACIGLLFVVRVHLRRRLFVTLPMLFWALSIALMPISMPIAMAVMLASAIAAAGR